jgi:hypothetical protein
VALAEYHDYSGDAQLLREAFVPLARLIALFERELDRLGLIPAADREGWWTFLDTGNINRAGYSAGLNFLFVAALGAAARVARVLGRVHEGARWQELARRVAAAARARFYAPPQGLYADNLVEEHPSDSFSEITNVLAALYAWPEGAEAAAPGGAGAEGAPAARTPSTGGAASVRRIPPTAVPAPSSMALLGRLLSGVQPLERTCSGLGQAGLVEALFRHGFVHEAVAELLRWWGGMLERGATTFWEVFDPELPPLTVPFSVRPHDAICLCHAWSTAPLYLLQNYVLGILPLSGGFRQVRILPGLCEAVRSAQGRMPTPRGEIRLDWRYQPAGSLPPAGQAAPGAPPPPPPPATPAGRGELALQLKLPGDVDEAEVLLPPAAAAEPGAPRTSSGRRTEVLVNDQILLAPEATYALPESVRALEREGEFVRLVLRGGASFRILRRDL